MWDSKKAKDYKDQVPWPRVKNLHIKHKKNFMKFHILLDAFVKIINNLIITMEA